jgi:hypothetical protein
MKKLILILAVIFVFSIYTDRLFASDSADIKKSYYGAVFGFNFARLIGDDSDAAYFYGGGEKKSRTGIAAGAFAHWGVGNILAIEPQVLYSANGGKYGDAFPAWNDEWTLQIDYLEVPVIVRVYIPPIPIVKANVFGGGYFGYNLKAKYKYTEIGYEEEGDLDDILIPKVEDFDYGLVFGAGAVYPIGNVIARLDLKYTLGLAKIWDYPPDDDIRTGMFSIIASIGF